MEPASSAPASNGDIMEEVGTGKDAGKLKQAPSTSAAAAALDAMRAYRACLHCRSRKTKCNLDVNGGKPPCKRCQRENRECVLGDSHRGGRRVRKKPKLTGSAPQPSQLHITSMPTDQVGNPASISPPNFDQASASFPYSSGHTYESSYDSSRQWQGNTQSVATGSGSEGSGYHGHQRSPTTSYKSRALNEPIPATRVPARENIAIADLHNPSDALDILAEVADREDDESKRRIGVTQIDRRKSVSWQNDRNSTKLNDHLYYKPVNDGLISSSHVYYLFSIFQKHYHAYFPVVPSDSFRRDRIPWLSKVEPHLFSAILTVASKDDAKTHQICYDHMQSLVSMIVAGADADVEAVEALLLLSQWISHRPHSETTVGRGEEGRVAWMYVGTALRLGWYLGIDQAAFRGKGDQTEGLASYNRKRVLWSACYMADRNISVRLGKGFWAVGPGPLQFSDFPSLLPSSPNEDNLAIIFQAQLSLAQIFSNVHDILYCSKGYGWMEMLEGRYAKYLDDFRTSILNWDEKWGNIECSQPLKGSLLLSFDYLRLYVNAFAYQATISRAMLQFKGSESQQIPLLDAGTPDARFIYEAINAAKSLINTFNTVVEPHVLRCMPYRYCLYVVYSAVFLYKARSTTTMSEQERFDIRRMISAAIDRLERSSTGANQTGSRYSRLLQLLWRKAPRTMMMDGGPTPSLGQTPLPHQDGMLSAPAFDSSAFSGLDIPDIGNGQPDNGGTFSWLDLGGAWNYVTADDGMGGVGNAMHSQGMGMDEAMANAEPGPYSMNLNLLADYRLLGDDSPGLIF